jgi:hypothetical protein
MYLVQSPILNNRGVYWLRVNMPCRLSLFSGYTWRVRKENWLLSRTFFRTTTYFAFSEISLHFVPWWKRFSVNKNRRFGDDYL